MSDIDPHPPTRHCNCPKCLASFDDTALDPEIVAAVSACLGDDAAMLRDTHPEASNNMDAAATLIDRMYELVLGVESLPPLERGDMQPVYQAMARKLYAKYQDGTPDFETMSAQDLSNLLRSQVNKGDPVAVADLCALLLFLGKRIEAEPVGQLHAFETPPPGGEVVSVFAAPVKPEPAAHMFPSDLEKFKSQETFAHAYSVKVNCPGEASVELFTLQQLQEICHPYVEGCRLALEYLQDSEATISDLSLVLASLLRLRDSPVQAGLEARLLGNLLARIHGDGGDHVLEHGLEKAAADAEDMVATWQNLVTAVRGDLGIAEFLPEAERGALEKMYQAMARKLYAKHREGTAGFETASAEHLSSLLRRHVTKGDPVDVANFCAFLLFNGDRIEPLKSGSWPAQFLTEPEASHVAAEDLPLEGLGPFKSGGLVHQFETPPAAGESAAILFDLQRQPPKGWGVYRVPNSTDILISKPNGDGVCVAPDSDPLLYELASAMLPPAGSDQSNF